MVVIKCGTVEYKTKSEHGVKDMLDYLTSLLKDHENIIVVAGEETQAIPYLPNGDYHWAVDKAMSVVKNYLRIGSKYIWAKNK